MVVKILFLVFLCLIVEFFLNIFKLEFFILNSKFEIGVSVFWGGIKSIIKIG